MLSRPALKGTEIVGQTLSASPGSWDTPALTFTYQWARDWVNIPNAIGATYQLQTADIGKKVTVIVVTHKSGYDTTTKRSAATGTILGVRPICQRNPVLEGARQVGRTLSFTGTGEWNTPGLTFSIQWYWVSGGQRIPMPGVTGHSYVVKPTDLGHVVGFSVTAFLAGHADGFAGNSTFNAIRAGDAPKSTVRPAVSGTAKVGATLTSTTGAWSAEGQTFSWQWMRNGTEIPGATHSVYRPVAADRGSALVATVTASRQGYLDGIATTPPTAPVL